MTVALIQITGTMTIDQSSVYKNAAGQYTSGPSAASYTILCDPPKNVAGKPCLLEALYINHGPTVTTGLVANNGSPISFVVEMTSIWSQFYSTPNNPQNKVINGVLHYTQGLTTATDLGYTDANFVSFGPTIVQVPAGPFPLKIKCFRPDGTAISGFTATDLGKLQIMASLQLTPIE